MATRRRPTTDVRSRTGGIAIPTSKTRAAAAAAAAITRNVEAAVLVQLEPGPSNPTPQKQLPPMMSPTKRRPDGKESEMNVQVVVRCRSRSEREMKESSPIIVSIQGAMSDEVTIETAAPTSTLGITTHAPTRTYPFDRVFGPEADQALIYNEVVQPIVEEVIAGYNCTLFAYGQTGTGKTYTMQGDLTPSVTGGPGANAGMIPRVLSKLYQHLESSVADYSVKISYIELYNEELRDLLAPDLPAPNGSTQPMGMGQGQKDNGLKIFDEAGAGKRGVMIQGLEDTPVKDAKDAINLLRKGSLKRQVAATKFNDHSSRSHSVFTITVYTKETCAKGDDTLRVGKLNLVDLAGSENIGRSGAENKRAREAGMINQSLLTLGRVINALVDKSAHIPYRESKLTRLLQDSLGGRTKTCLIATVSPARSNMEETLSTLDYAIRAKTIQNRPEINQRMTRNALIKEYVADIERLKSDLLAAREKNGIWFSNESWQEMSNEHEQMKTLHAESKRQVEIISSQMRAVREEFEQGMALLMKKDKELEETQTKLERTEKDLFSTANELSGTREKLDEETVVREAHQRTEANLHSVAEGLRSTVMESVNDISGLFAKLERKDKVLRTNLGTVVKHGGSLQHDVTVLDSILTEFVAKQTELVKSSESGTKDLLAAQIRVHDANLSNINNKLAKLEKAMKIIESTESEGDKAMSTVQLTLKNAIDDIQSGLELSRTMFVGCCNELIVKMTAINDQGLNTAAKALTDMSELVGLVLSETNSYIEHERKAHQDILDMTDQATQAEVQRLESQNSLLTTLLDSEKAKAERMRDELLQQVSSLLVNFTDARDKSVREAVCAVRSDIAQGQKEMQEFAEDMKSQVDGALTQGTEVTSLVERRGGENKRLRDGGLKALSMVASESQASMTTLKDSIDKNMQNQEQEMCRLTDTIQSTYDSALEHTRRSKRARVDATVSLSQDASGHYQALLKESRTSKERIREVADRMASTSGSLQHSAEELRASTSTSLGSIRRWAQKLVSDGAKEDRATGLTPQKRQWDYVDAWSLTKSRDEILQDWRSLKGRVENRPSTDVIVDDEEGINTEEDTIHLNLGTASPPIDTLSGQENILPSPGIPPSPDLSTSTSTLSTSDLVEPPPTIPVPTQNRPTQPGTRRSTASILKAPMQSRKTSGFGFQGLSERPTNVTLPGRPRRGLH
ncbi:kinesin motor protein cin8 [Tulasnella sp. 418]|nr:kinesin motor protein cin8 [Tulasnella sp. 418]